ncbi:MAG: CoA:oxalate CoA-transferase [Gammaproteobacteria bacterium]|jgi:CoA:oxalate CoA-transferase
MSTRKPLEHIKILDFSAVYAGPICARLLSDCGADVIKVETPGIGDVTRGPKGTSRVFSHFNAGKRSIAINLKTKEGQSLAHELVKEADVVIENFRPGVMHQFGLDYESLKKENPKLVYCSISGFGQSGPLAQRAAYAPIAHVASGFDIAHMQSQGDENTKPTIWGIMIADILSGSYAFGAIQTALLGRAYTGEGDYIDMAMLDAMMTLIPGQMQIAQIEDAPTGGGFRPVEVKDGYVMICIVSPKNMRQICDATKKPELLTDVRFTGGRLFKNMAEFVVEIESWTKNLSAVECEKVLNDFGVPCSVYNAAEDLFDHPQILARRTFTEQEDQYGMFKIQNAPFTFAKANVATSNKSPMLGEHTQEVLTSVLSLTTDQVDELKAQKVIA